MEDTQNQKAENEAIIAQLLASAERAPEPGDLKANPIVDGSAEGEQPPAVITTLESAGYCYIYDTETAERSLCNLNMLPATLKKRRENGTLVFTTVKPPFLPKRGTVKCMLHPDSPMRSEYDALGLPTCRKANLMNDFQMRRHMEKRHPQEWRALEQQRTDAELNEEREFRKLMMERLTAVAEEPQKAITAKDIVKEHLRAETKNSSPQVECEVCGKRLSKQGLMGHMRSHAKELEAQKQEETE